VAVEGTRSATRWQTITIKVKTDATTISEAEFKKIKKGMTGKQVRKIVRLQGRSRPILHERTHRLSPLCPDRLDQEGSGHVQDLVARHVLLKLDRQPGGTADTSTRNGPAEERGSTS
jgi:hypothetical protein